MNAADILFGDAYAKREAAGKIDDDSCSCAVCGRPTNGHLLVSADDTTGSIGDDMGWFPIGSECRKRAERAGLTVAEQP